MMDMDLEAYIAQFCEIVFDPPKQPNPSKMSVEKLKELIEQHREAGTGTSCKRVRFLNFELSRNLLTLLYLFHLSSTSMQIPLRNRHQFRLLYRR